MSKWIKIKARWYSEEQQKKIDLGLSIDGSYELKEIILNIDNYSIEEYQGYIYIEKEKNDGYITNLKYNEININNLVGDVKHILKN
jgi:hypothetical protein